MRSHAVALAVLASSVLFSASEPVSAQGLTLGDAVDAALGSHPSVPAARGRSASAHEATRLARSGRLPDVTADGTVTRFQEPMVVAPLHAFDPLTPPSFDRSLVQARVGVGYTLFDAGARGARVRAGSAMEAAAALAETTTEMAVIEEAAAAFLGVATTRAVLAAAASQVTALQAELTRAERTFAAGTAAELTVLRAAATADNARAELASAQARASLAERTLARVTGWDVTRVSASDIEIPELASPALSDGSGATNPTVAASSRAVEAADARLSEQRATRWPVVRADLGLADYGTVGGNHTAEWQAGLRVSWPIFSGGARGARTRSAAADLDAARAELSLAELRTAQEVDAARTAIVEADARIEALRVAVEQWQEVARIERLALSAGSGVQSDLLTAESGLFRATAALALATHDASIARIRLARVEGVLDRGWLTAATEAR